jgi:hypothetical protein
MSSKDLGKRAKRDPHARDKRKLVESHKSKELPIEHPERYEGETITPEKLQRGAAEILRKKALVDDLPSQPEPTQSTGDTGGSDKKPGGAEQTPSSLVDLSTGGLTEGDARKLLKLANALREDQKTRLVALSSQHRTVETLLKVCCHRGNSRLALLPKETQNERFSIGNTGVQ